MLQMITRERVLEILKEAGVLLEGHFLLTSGKHSNRYLQCAKIFRNTKYSEELCRALAEQFQDADRRWVPCKWLMKSVVIWNVKTFSQSVRMER